MTREVVYTTDEATAWSSVLPAEESAFGSVEFARVVQRHQGYQARLYVLHDRAAVIAYPFFTRPIQPSLQDPDSGGRLSDTVSPDFTGPLTRGIPPRSLAAAFSKRLASFFSRQQIVAEFIHLHPWKAFTKALRQPCVTFDREIVFVDLTRPADELWETSFNHACRKNINRSRREHVRVFEARTRGDIREFHRIYVQTMRERNALEHYFFSLEYFEDIFDTLRGSARFALAEYRGQVIAGTLYLHDRDDIYSYLGGADVNFQHVRPTNAVIYDTVVWGRQHGKRRLILGGGYSAGDGIFRFKASFSPARANFLVYRCVHLPETYEALCRSCAGRDGRDLLTTEYFPGYRRVPHAETAASCPPAAAASAHSLY
jgi:hypothetical protein